MEWLLFYQGMRDKVHYISSLSEEKDFLDYNVFLSFLNSEFPRIKEFFKLKENLDKFKTIVIYKSGEWEVIKEETEDASFDVLFSLNNVEEKKSDFERHVDKSKTFIQGIFDYNKKNFKNRKY